MLKKLIIILLFALPIVGFSAEPTKGGESTKVNKRTKIEILNRKARPLSLIGEIDAYYLHFSRELQISFPSSEGWADLLISTPMGDVVHKERFHTAFEFSTYIGVPDMPWKIEIFTTQGGEYEGWLILQE